MNKRKMYMITDTETATLPFVDEIAFGDPNIRKAIAIARPLIYDIGWILMYRDGTVAVKRQFLVAEIFSVPNVFKTAYYKEKRPIYLEMLAKGEIEIKTWNEIMEIFLEDMAKADYIGAFNSMFDFKKAIPFTELYIKKLYSADYQAWENSQKNLCKRIAAGSNKKNPHFDGEHFSFRGEECELFDIWGMACKHLLNRVGYKKMCLDYGMLTNSGEYFKSSAESAYRYLKSYFDFEEAHTALADAEIEGQILSKILKNHAVTVGIEFFPFRQLGYTDDFVTRNKRPNMAHVQTVYDAMDKYVGDDEYLSRYKVKIRRKMDRLEEVMGLE